MTVTEPNTWQSPFLQGARLTAWELMKDGIDTTLITDSSAGSLMRAGEIDLVVGAPAQLHQGAAAVGYHGADLFIGQGRTTVHFQYRVQGIGQIGGGIEQRAVQVEQDSTYRHAMSQAWRKQAR